MIRLRLIGPADVVRSDDGASLRLPGRALPLLAYLAVEGEAPRQELCRLFWEGADDAPARHSLRQSLTVVRKGLGVDPFLGSDPLELNPELVSVDIADCRRALALGEDAGVDALVRGPILQGLDFSYSDRLGDWHAQVVDRWRQELGTHLLRRYGNALMAGRRQDMNAAMAVARRAGLDPALFPLASDTSAVFLPTRSGRAAVGSVVYRSRAQMPNLLVRCLDGGGNELAVHLSSFMDELPAADRPCLVQVDPSASDRDSPLGIVLALLRALVDAPGGAGVHVQTRRLASDERSGVAPADFATALEGALADALDAVMEEASVIATLPARALTPEAARLLRNSVEHTFAAGGFTLVLVGADALELSSKAAQELGSAFPCTLSITVAPSEAPSEAPVAASGQAPPMAPHRPRRRLWKPVAVGLAIVGVLGVAAGMRLTADPLISLDGGELVVCSDRSGTMNLYRVDPRSSKAERLSPLTLIGCPVPPSLGWDESGYLAAPVRDGDTPLVVKLDLRGNPRRDAPELARTTLPAWVERGDQLFYHFGPGRSVMMAAAQENDTLFAAVLDHATWTLKEVVLPIEGVYRAWAGAVPPQIFVSVRRSGVERLATVDLESGALEIVTPDDQSVSRAWVWGTSHIVYQVGASGSEEDGSLELWDLDRVSGARRRLTTNDWNDHELVVRADGTGVCWKSEESGHWASDIMFMDIGRLRPQVLTRSSSRDQQCAWTPDGRAILYTTWVELPDVRNALMIKSVAGGAPREVVPAVSVNTFVGFFKAGAATKSAAPEARAP